MKDIVSKPEEKRKPVRQVGGGKRPGYIKFAVASLSLALAACSPPNAAQAELVPWTSPDGRFQIEFAGNNWVVLPPPYSASEIVVEAENRLGTAGCQLSVLVEHGPPGSQREVNAAVRTLSDEMTNAESARARNYQLHTREVDSVTLLESSGQYGGAMNTVTRFGLYHDGALNFYTLACGAAADDAASAAAIRTVVGSLRFLVTENP